MKRIMVILTVLFGFGLAVGDIPRVCSQETEEFTLEEITVTAQKREENQRKVGIAMEVISGAFINRTGEGLRVSLRGVGFDIPADFGEGAMNAPGTVAVNINGVFSAKKPTGTGLYDVERVEVLYGPQNTMYVTNSPGGIINVVTAVPKLDTYELSSTLEYGNYNLLHFEGVANAPLSESFALRAAGNYTVRDGYFSNGGDNEG